MGTIAPPWDAIPGAGGAVGRATAAGAAVEDNNVFAKLFTREWLGEVKGDSTPVGRARWSAETACLTMTDYLVGPGNEGEVHAGAPTIFTLLGKDVHPELIALIVRELLRLVGPVHAVHAVDGELARAARRTAQLRRRHKARRG